MTLFEKGVGNKVHQPQSKSLGHANSPLRRVEDGH